MALKVDASFENGVFIPAERPRLAESARVRLTIETRLSEQTNSSSPPSDQGLSHVGLPTDRDRAVALDFHPDGC